MNKKIRINFLLIAVVQGLHSIEETYGKLWDVYQPATFLSGLVSNDLRSGFLAINISLFIVLMLIWLGTFSKNFPKAILWIWVVLESINGIGHSLWALTEWSYVPGLATAPILLFLAVRLGMLLTKANEHV